MRKSLWAYTYADIMQLRMDRINQRFNGIFEGSMQTCFILACACFSMILADRYNADILSISLFVGLQGLLSAVELIRRLSEQADDPNQVL